MGVEVATNYKTVPALEYKNFFAEDIHIHQDKIENSGDLPIFSIRILYRMYAIDDNGKWYYDQYVDSLEVDDFMELANIAPQEQSISLFEVMAMIEFVVAKIFEMKSGVPTELI